MVPLYQLIDRNNLVSKPATLILVPHFSWESTSRQHMAFHRLGKMNGFPEHSLQLYTCGKISMQIFITSGMLRTLFSLFPSIQVSFPSPTCTSPTLPSGLCSQGNVLLAWEQRTKLLASNCSPISILSKLMTYGTHIGFSISLLSSSYTFKLFSLGMLYENAVSSYILVCSPKYVTRCLQNRFHNRSLLFCEISRILHDLNFKMFYLSRQDFLHILSFDKGAHIS